MKVTLSVIKADIGSIGGHVAPSKQLQETVVRYIHDRALGLLLDHYISHTGDDIAILMTHTGGEGDERIHKLAWDAFRAGTKEAREEGLYGAGQDLLKDSFSGNVKGMVLQSRRWRSKSALTSRSCSSRPIRPILALTICHCTWLSPT
jgi:fructose 1,6-bisphosphate aldolase/phosphatase